MHSRNSEGQNDASPTIRPLITGRRSLQASGGQPKESSLFDNLPVHVEDELLNMLDDRSSLLPEIHYEAPCWMSFIPLTDSQMINNSRFRHSQNLAWSRHQALESALSIASQLSGSMENSTGMAVEVADNEEQRSIPSLEFLYWMLNGRPNVQYLFLL